MPDERPDDELLNAYRAGDERAAAALFDRYHSRLMGLVRSELGARVRAVEGSTDVAQSVLRSLFGRSRKREIEVSPEGSLWPILVTITLNKIRNRDKFWKRQRRDRGREVAMDDWLDPLAREPSPEDAAILKDLVGHLLEPFSERRRRILEMILQGHGVGEIAEAVGTSERTIYNTRKAAEQVLAGLLAEE